MTAECGTNGSGKIHVPRKITPEVLPPTSMVANHETLPEADVEKGCLARITDWVVGKIENGFAKFGAAIGRRPWTTIGVSLILAGLCMIGMLRHSEENREWKLWIDQDSILIPRQDWVEETFPTRMRYVYVLVEHDDILSPQGLMKVWEVDRKVKEVYKDANDTTVRWENICYSVDQGGSLCLPDSILEIWSYNETLIRSLQKDDIIKTLNQPVLLSPLTNRNITLDALLAGVSGNATHKYVSSTVAKTSYYLKKNQKLDTGSNTWKDPSGEKWEKELAVVMKKGHAGVAVKYSTRTSYRDASLDAIGNDVVLLSIGYLLIIMYVATMLGRFSRIEQKFWLAAACLLVVGVSMGTSFGISAAIGTIYGPVHMIIPFLLLGIGVDDIFVIVQTWDNVAGRLDDEEPISIKVSRTMRHAGVAITVTSFTDITAFMIGATTVLPALSSFCIYAGFGILCLFFFSCTIFMGALTLDGMRQRKRRDACLPCLTLPTDYEASSCSQKSYLQLFIKNIFTKYLLTIPGKRYLTRTNRDYGASSMRRFRNLERFPLSLCSTLVVIVLIATATLFGFGMYGVYSIEQDFDPDSFLPPDSDELIYRQANKQYFPVHGVATVAYVKKVDYFKDQSKLTDLYNNMRNDPYVESSSVISWYPHYKQWLQTDPEFQPYLVNGLAPNVTKFYGSVRKFLTATQEGSQYASDVKMDNQTNEIYASRYRAKHTYFKGTSAEIAAMDSVTASCEKVKFSDGQLPFVLSNVYRQWETNKIIKKEIVRNLLLASGCVFVVTLFLIANLWTALMVLLGVACTLVDLLGFLYFWGMNIDSIISCILVVALGFSIDYSAHIGHAFMSARRGNRNHRASVALVEMGPAVFNGGFSTFLAFCSLAGSSSYAFKTFFKVFFLVVAFGQFHGMVFLPVLLSIMGPQAYGNKTPPECVEMGTPNKGMTGEQVGDNKDDEDKSKGMPS